MTSARTRFLAAPLAGAALVVSLAACGSSGGGSNDAASFCNYLQTKSSALQGASSKSGESALQDFVDKAPSDIKGAFQTLLDAAKNPTSGAAAKAQSALTQIETWGKNNCAGVLGS